MSQPEHSRPWTAPTATARIDARVQLPGSKSLTNRALLLAALADGPSTLHRPLRSRDAAIMAEGLRALGAAIREVPGDGAFGPDLEIAPAPVTGGGSIDCGLAGTAMRFLPIVAALGDGPVAFDGDPHARKRPMQQTIAALQGLGVRVDADEPRLPFTVHGAGGVAGGELEIDASASSQFVSALLLAAPRFERGLTLHHRGERLPSLPHIEMTLEALRQRGVDARSTGEASWRVEPGPIAALDEQIEPDLSNAAPFLAAVVAVGGRVVLDGWPESTTQVGRMLPELLAAFGARSRVADGSLTVEAAGGEIPGASLDMHAAGELSPTVVALGALASGPVEVTGIGHTRGHETDRIRALIDNIAALGGRATELPDGIRVEPGPLAGGDWSAYDDHRIATAGAVLGLRVPGVEVDDIGATAKTIPEFPELWAAMLEGRDLEPGATPGPTGAGPG
ncbi:3-phosphoshikimate 1-carboxyvinyltransferase [Agrococcus baldri]|uniref:3-phosphoshikimate 1-carboxyvinyltransferase n=1 Tax=Agrococcus baldri TaxID=153730 RepID=A0AA87R900_9MICO|nr:3-phosphoshikimate 1-carboxyvinyltransferase [Agrococcus baldri]GEK78829.1 3-phosphoshikimate 1-carboxyvinyltransferase 1 [Agrococcus baldri]